LSQSTDVFTALTDELEKLEKLHRDVAVMAHELEKVTESQEFMEVRKVLQLALKQSEYKRLRRRTDWNLNAFNGKVYFRVYLKPTLLGRIREFFLRSKFEPELFFTINNGYGLIHNDIYNTLSDPSEKISLASSESLRQVGDALIGRLADMRRLHEKQTEEV
jgi:hypothetical protein